MLSILQRSWCLGILSGALLTSIIMKSVLKACLEVLRPSRIVQTMFVKKVFVERLGIKPCWPEESEMCGVMFYITDFSSILEEVESSNIEL